MNIVVKWTFHLACGITSKVVNNVHADGLVQDCSNSIAKALDLLQSCTKPSTYSYGLPVGENRGNKTSLVPGIAISYALEVVITKEFNSLRPSDAYMRR